MTKHTYTLEGHSQVQVVIHATNSNEASSIASVLGQKWGELLIGPHELSNQTVYL